MRADNYGGTVSGPWVFGMIDVEGKELLLIQICKRETVTVCQEIRRHVAPGTVIVMDKWAACRWIPTLRENNGTSLNFTHMTVNHRNNFFNPVAGATCNPSSRRGGQQSSCC